LFAFFAFTARLALAFIADFIRRNTAKTAESYRRMVRSSFEVADFFIDEPIFLRNMRIFKKKIGEV